jgi:hypothetical protein
MDKDEVRSQSEEPARPEEPVVVMKASELAARVEEFLATKQVVAPADAGQIARAMAESLAQGLKPAEPRKAGRPARPKAEGGELGATAVNGQPTVREKSRRPQPMAGLRSVLLADVLYSL